MTFDIFFKHNKIYKDILCTSTPSMGLEVEVHAKSQRVMKIGMEEVDYKYQHNSEENNTVQDKLVQEVSIIVLLIVKDTQNTNLNKERTICLYTNRIHA